MAVSAAVILDSVSPTGQRLTTFEVTLHRFVLAEMNTHRVFSRNSASSRAIPIEKQIARVLDEPAMPVEFGTNQPGMQAGPPLTHDNHALWDAQDVWINARDAAVVYARQLMELNVHKQIVNRLLEPFMWHTMIISSTEMVNFFTQRASEYSPLAQPEIRAAADLMLAAYNASTPSLVENGRYHLPYILDEERTEFDEEELKKISSARCARVSYLTHDGRRDVSKDFDLYGKLVTEKPPHGSPLEHVATPAAWNFWKRFGRQGPMIGNFMAWQQLRYEAGI